MKLSLVLAAFVAIVSLATAVLPSSPSSASAAPVLLTSAVAAPHCQVPCGIYGDPGRVVMMMEDAATIEKGMAQLGTLGAEAAPNYNQIVRWTMTKDQHAQSIQDTVAAYWLAQRIKAPKEAKGEDQAKYLHQLALMHQITVAAMKCKQTTDPAHVEHLRSALKAFVQTYFSEEDRKHLAEHLGG